MFLYRQRLCFSLLILILFCVSGEKGTLTHGSVVDGRFEGFIKTHQGTYYVEPSERYLKDKNVPFHSIIYHEDDISKCLPLHLLYWKALYGLVKIFYLTSFMLLKNFVAFNIPSQRKKMNTLGTPLSLHCRNRIVMCWCCEVRGWWLSSW